MIQEAFISGQRGKAIYSDGGRYFVLDVDHPEQPVECRPIDVSTFFCFGADVSYVAESRISLATISTELEARRRARQALSLVISGMDDELEDDIRSSAIERAEGLMKEESTRRFVRARMLARALPAEADVETARDIAIQADATVIGILYQNVIDYSQAIKVVHNTWTEAAPQYFSSYQKQVEAEAKLTDIGAFADAASAVATENRIALNSLVVTYGQMPELRGILGPLVL